MTQVHNLLLQVYNNKWTCIFCAQLQSSIDISRCQWPTLSLRAFLHLLIVYDSICHFKKKSKSVISKLATLGPPTQCTATHHLWLLSPSNFAQWSYPAASLAARRSPALSCPCLVVVPALSARRGRGAGVAVAGGCRPQHAALQHCSATPAPAAHHRMCQLHSSALGPGEGDCKQIPTNQVWCEVLDITKLSRVQGCRRASAWCASIRSSACSVRRLRPGPGPAASCNSHCSSIDQNKEHSHCHYTR